MHVTAIKQISCAWLSVNPGQHFQQQPRHLFHRDFAHRLLRSLGDTAWISHLLGFKQVGDIWQRSTVARLEQLDSPHHRCGAVPIRKMAANGEPASMDAAERESLKQASREKYLVNDPTAPVDPVTFRINGYYKYRGMVLCGFNPEHLVRKVEELRFEDDDIIISSYPKTGTTFTQEMMYLVRNGGDVDEANKEYTFLRIPFIEFDDPNAGIEAFNKCTRPRTIKTHLPFECFEHQILRDGTRFVYVMRNPKDTLVSYYHFYKSCYMYGGFYGTFSDFFQMFLCDNICYGNMFDHFLSWWRHRHLPNVLILKYEDLIRRPSVEIGKVARFCGKELDDAAIGRIVEATSFDVMKSNPKTNCVDTPFIDEKICPFIRKGKIGDWKNYFTVAQNEEMERIITKRLKDTGLEFEFE